MEITKVSNVESLHDDLLNCALLCTINVLDERGSLYIRVYAITIDLDIECYAFL